MLSVWQTSISPLLCSQIINCDEGWETKRLILTVVFRSHPSPHCPSLMFDTLLLRCYVHFRVVQKKFSYSLIWPICKRDQRPPFWAANLNSQTCQKRKHGETICLNYILQVSYFIFLYCTPFLWPFSLPSPFWSVCSLSHFDTTYFKSENAIYKTV